VQFTGLHMNTTPPQTWEARILPALHRIQDRFGYLTREAMEQVARDVNVKLYQVNAVASFYPHFRTTPPPKVTLHVCRDMACHMAGSGRQIKELSALASKDIAIEGVSCLGRCDRPAVACLSVHSETGNGDAHGEHGDTYFYGLSTEQLKQVIQSAEKGGKPRQAAPAHGAAKSEPPGWTIDVYNGEPSNYEGVNRAVAVRRASLTKAADDLKAAQGWSRGRAEQFIAAAESRLIVDFTLDKDMIDAVVKWQCEDNWADEIFKEMDDAHADLRGLGGAGIPATQKWRDLRDAVRNLRKRKADDRAFIVVNGDESEPGTFKDRELLLQTPHLIIEGVILAGLLTEATQGFIYIRHEYPEQIAACEKEILRAQRLGVCGPSAGVLGRSFPVSAFTSPGGYVCGEQSALIEAINDRRSEPRNMPPKLETNGLDDQPTLVSNVETYGWVPYIWVKGGQSYADLGVNKCKGRRFFSISGDIIRPGVYEVPMGMTLRELIEGQEHCQGIVGGRKLKAFAPSGPSGGFLPAKLKVGVGLPPKHTENRTWKAIAERRGFDPASTELDILDLELELNVFRALSPTGALGAGMVVYAEGRNMFDQAINAVEFYRNESCGKCVPCRIGSQKLAALGDNLRQAKIGLSVWNDQVVPLIKDLGEAMTLSSICGLGRSVPVPLQTAIQFFPDDLLPYTTAAEQRAAKAGSSRPAAAPPAAEPEAHP
jgi:NADH:ubiquinone oxidoreductase subunit F (NADH-binding)/NADH:ubiquinone oxidoreductase subunit E